MSIYDEHAYAEDPMTAAICFGVADHIVRRLDGGDIPLIRQLFNDGCADFFRLIDANPTAEAEAIFDDVPAGKRPEDKLVFGISSRGGHDRLSGVVELLRDYPTHEQWCLGLLLIAPTHRGAGLGATVLASVVQFVSVSGGSTLHLVVQEQNPAALRFWQRHGFVVRDKVVQSAASGMNRVDRLVLTLPRPPNAST